MAGQAVTGAWQHGKHTLTGLFITSIRTSVAGGVAGEAVTGAWQLLAAISAIDAGACSWDFLQVCILLHRQAQQTCCKVSK